MGVNYSPRIITDGLVLCLDAANKKSYSGTGTIWEDLSQNKINGTLVNSVGYSDENGGNLTFNGVDNYITINQTQNGSAFTYETFLKSTNVSKDQMYAGHVANAFYLRIVNSRAFLSLNAAGQRTMSHDTILENNKIYHIVSIYDSVQLKIYVNNILTVGTVINQPMTSWAMDRIGRWRDADQRSFVGSIYTLRAYNRALTAPEVLQNYNALKGRFGL